MKRNCTSYILATMALVGICMVAVVSFAGDKVITLRYSNWLPPTDPNSLIANEWCKEVEKRTNGKVRVKYYPGSTLNSVTQMYESVVEGVIDIGNVISGYTQGRFPLMSGLWENPWKYPSGYAATKIVTAAYEKFKPKELDQVEVMYFHVTPDGVIHTARKPVNKLEDLKGLKLRSMGANAEILPKLGVSPVAIPISELYDALSKGVLDGVIAANYTLKTWKLADVLKYTTPVNGTAFTAVYIVAMNKNKWNSISLDQQKIIRQINQEWTEKQGKLWDVMEKEGRDYAMSRGMRVIKLPAEEQAKWDSTDRFLFDEYRKKMKGKNLPGDEMVKFVREQLKKAQ